MALVTFHSHALSFAAEQACPLLTDPENGKVEVSGQTRGSIATYSCNVGFELFGHETVECTHDFLWSSDPPICVGEALMHLLLYTHTMHSCRLHVKSMEKFFRLKRCN